MQIDIARKGQLFLLLSFAALVIIGTALLLLPGILNEGTLSVTDALFMACSAVCLNGLATVPLDEFSFGGQLVLLILIQVGTLGIMTLSAMILLLMGKGFSYGDALLISSINERFTLRGAEQLTSTIVHYTLLSEAVGAVLLLPGFVADGHGWYSLWYSLYYAIGSFCNAGLGPLPGSCASLNRYSQIICMCLMVLGGLGVYVIYEHICHRAVGCSECHLYVSHRLGVIVYLVYESQIVYVDRYLGVVYILQRQHYLVFHL